MDNNAGSLKRNLDTFVNSNSIPNTEVNIQAEGNPYKDYPVSPSFVDNNTARNEVNKTDKNYGEMEYDSLASAYPENRTSAFFMQNPTALKEIGKAKGNIQNLYRAENIIDSAIKGWSSASDLNGIARLRNKELKGVSLSSGERLMMSFYKDKLNKERPYEGDNPSEVVYSLFQNLPRMGRFLAVGAAISGATSGAGLPPYLASIIAGGGSLAINTKSMHNFNKGILYDEYLDFEDEEGRPIDQEKIKERVKEDAVKYTLLDSIGMVASLGRLSKLVFGAATKTATGEVTKKVTTNNVRKFISQFKAQDYPGSLKTIGLGAVKLGAEAGIEGATEVAQELVTLQSEFELTKNEAINILQVLKDPEYEKRIKKSFDIAFKSTALLNFIGISGSGYMNYRKAKRSIKENEVLRNLLENTKKTNVSSDQKENFQSAITKIVGRKFHIDSVGLERYAEENGIDLDELLVELGISRKVFEQSKEMQLKMEVDPGKVLTSDHAEDLVDDVSINPDTETLNEVDIEYERALNKLYEEQELYSEKRDREPKKKEHIDYELETANIRYDIEENLDSIEKPKDASILMNHTDIVGDVIASFFKGLALSSGASPLGLYKKYFVQFRSSLKQDEGAPFAKGEFEQKGDTSQITFFKSATNETVFHEIGHFIFETIHRMAMDDVLSPKMKKQYKSLISGVFKNEGDKLSIETSESLAKLFTDFLVHGDKKGLSSEFKEILGTVQELMIGAYAVDPNSSLADDITNNFFMELFQHRAVRSNAEDNLGLDIGVGFGDYASEYSPLIEGMNSKMQEEERASVQEKKAPAKKKLTRKEYNAVKEGIIKEMYKNKLYRLYFAVYSRTEAEKKFFKGSEILEKRLPIVGPLKKDSLKKYLSDKELLGFRSGTFKKSRYLRYVNIDDYLELFNPKNAKDLIMEFKGLEKPIDYVKRQIELKSNSKGAEKHTPEKIEQRTYDRLIYSSEAKEIRKKDIQFILSKLKEEGVEKTFSFKDIADYVENEIGNRTVQDTNSEGYLKSIGRASRESADFFRNGDYNNAFNAKIREILASKHYEKAREVEISMEEYLDLISRVNIEESKLREIYDMDFISILRAALYHYGEIEKPVRAESHLKFIREASEERYRFMRNLLRDITNYEEGTSIEELTVSEFLKTKELMRSVENIARDQLHIRTEKEENTVRSVSLKLTKHLKDIEASKERSDKQKERLSKIVDVVHEFATWGLQFERIESAIEQLDGGPHGPFRKHIYNILDKASNNHDKLIGRLHKQIISSMKDYSYSNHGVIKSKAMRRTFEKGKSEVLAMLLHMGTESGQIKLAKGFSRKPPDIIAGIRELEEEGIITDADWRFVESIWAAFSDQELRTRLSNSFYKSTGLRFRAIKGIELKTLSGRTLATGYYPFHTEKSRSIEGIDYSESIDGDTFFRDELLFPRGKGLYSPPILDLSAVGKNLSFQVRYATVKNPVEDVRKILKNKDLVKELDNKNPKILTNVILPALERVGTQKMIDDPNPDSSYSRIFKALRASLVVTYLGANIPNFLIQYLGASHALADVSAESLARGFSLQSRYLGTLKGKEIIDKVNKLSPYMEIISGAGHYEEGNVFREVLLADGLGFGQTNTKKRLSWIKTHALFLQRIAQNRTNYSVFLAAYDEAMSKDMDSDDAVKFAERVVRTTQGVSRPLDLSKLETSDPLTRLLLTFTNYPITQMNRVFMDAENSKLKKTAVLMASRLLTIGLYTAILSMVQEGLISGLRGYDSNEDEGIVAKSFHGTRHALVGYVPISGPAANFILDRGVFGREVFPSRTTIGAIPDILGRGAGSVKDIARGDFDAADLKNAVTALSISTGLPVRNIIGFGIYPYAVSSGDVDDPENIFETLQGILTGKVY